MSATASKNKVKKSYSLSESSLKFVRQQQRARKESSESRMLDMLLDEMRIQQEKETLAREMTAYYDSLTDEQVAEEAAWGKFAGEQLAVIMDSWEK